MRPLPPLWLSLILSAFAQTPDQDPILRAMRDELQRSLELKVLNLEPPYYISYSLEDGTSFSASASLGGLVTSRRDHFRAPDVRVRVGNYQFDNTNYVGSDFFFGARYATGRFPLDNTYPVLRRYLWLETDGAYKSALEAISRKRAALKNVAESEHIDDFARAEPVRRFEAPTGFRVDESVWLARVRALSRILARYPAVKSSAVDFSANVSVRYEVTSERTELRIPDSLAYLRARASAQAPDGMTLRDAIVFHALDSDSLPAEAVMANAVAALGERVTAMAKARTGEVYSGPVVFEGQAAAQVFAEILGRNLALRRRPVTEPGRAGQFAFSELEGRQGARVLPDWMDVVDDPLRKEWRGRPLFGSYEVDEEGVVPQPLPLVEKGVLKGFLLTRQPVRGYQRSNGRARLKSAFGAHAAAVSNLFICAGEAVPPAELEKKLLEICQARNKPYGILVRRMDFPSSATFDEIRRLLSGDAQAGGSHPVSLPLLTYRIYPGGREELVRGVRFRGLNVRSFKDILAAGNDENVFDFLENGAPFAMMGGGSYVAETSVIAPSVLIDDLELHPLEEELPKMPVVPPPEIHVAAYARE
jgi:predicted Zn-dependent protease